MAANALFTVFHRVGLRSIACAHCGEEAERKLPVYVAEEFPHVRVEACDTCRTYIKSADLTKNGLAVPVLEELASVALNLWAEQREYTKPQLNLFGM
jgi:FdhE protein